MTSAEIEVRNPSGLHVRPADTFVRAAKGYASRIRVENLSTGRGPGDAKSILSLLACGVEKGHLIRVSAEGEDEAEAVRALCELVAGGLGEPLEG